MERDKSLGFYENDVIYSFLSRTDLQYPLKVMKQALQFLVQNTLSRVAIAIRVHGSEIEILQIILVLV